MYGHRPGKATVAPELTTARWLRRVDRADGPIYLAILRALETAIAEVFAANPDKLAEYRSGKDKLFGFFVGQVMKASGGKANPAVVNELLKKALG